MHAQVWPVPTSLSSTLQSVQFYQLPGGSKYSLLPSFDWGIAWLQAAGPVLIQGPNAEAQALPQITLLPPRSERVHLIVPETTQLLWWNGQLGTFYQLFNKSLDAFCDQFAGTTQLPELATLFPTTSTVPELQTNWPHYWQYFIRDHTPPQTLNLQKALAIIQQQKARISVTKLAQEIDLSRRHLGRLFLHQIGLSPKLFLRIYRFQLAWQQLRQAHPPKLTDIGYDLGYYDQSHFIRECQWMTGKCPKELLRKHLINTNGAFSHPPPNSHSSPPNIKDSLHVPFLQF